MKIYVVKMDDDDSIEIFQNATGHVDSDDIVRVVRCKNCKHWTSENGLLCEMWNRYVSDEEFFCGFGERTETDE